MLWFQWFVTEMLSRLRLNCYVIESTVWSSQMNSVA